MEQTEPTTETTPPPPAPYRNPAASDHDRIAHDFGGYHKPSTPEVAQRHDDIRAQFKTIAQWMAEKLPAGREAALVRINLEQAMFWANAAVARTQVAP